MTVGEQNGQELAEVIDLHAFRERVRQPALPDNADLASAPGDNTQSYSFADGPTFGAMNRVYNVINGGPPSNGIGLYERVVTGSHQAWICPDQGSGEHFVVDKNHEVIEGLTTDLKVYDAQRAAALQPLVERLYTVGLAARVLLVARYGIQSYCKNLPPLYAGEAEIKLDIEDDRNRWLDVTRWRAAAGIGLLAVTHQRQEARQGLTDYLKDVLAGRHSYDMALQRAETLIGRNVPQEADAKKLTAFYQGFCNPLISKFTIKQLLDKSRPSHS